MNYGSLEEDLALERIMLAELVADAALLWRLRLFKLAKQREAEAVRARERIRELEERERQ